MMSHLKDIEHLGRTNMYNIALLLLSTHYLGLTLDCTLSYKQHIHNTKMKVTTRNNLLRKLANSKWGTNASTIRTTALALCYSATEYAAPVWARCHHAHVLYSELNTACRAINGCLLMLLDHDQVRCQIIQSS